MFDHGVYGACHLGRDCGVGLATQMGIVSVLRDVAFELVPEAVGPLQHGGLSCHPERAPEPGIAVLRDAFLAAVRRAMPAIRRTVCGAELDPSILTSAERLQFEGFQRRQNTNVLIQRMGADSVPIKRIVRVTGLSRGLVRRILRGEREDVFRLRQSSLTPWFPQLEQYWQDGCRNGAELWRQLRADGFQGSLRVVGEWATRQRRAEAAIPQGTGKCPPSRKIARMMTSGRHHLSKADSIFVAQVEHALPQLAQDRRLLDAFTSMVRNGEEDGLAEWINHAKASGLAALSRGLSADLDAVTAALREPWSDGQTKGQINRLKVLKRQMYGAAGIDLLLARLQHSAWRRHRN